MNTWFGLGQSFGSGQLFEETSPGANPGAATNYTHKLDPRYRSRLVEIVFTLTTDANAANRYVTVENQDGDGNTLSAAAAAVTVSANSTQRFVGQLGRGVAEWAANTDVLFPLSPRFLSGGQLIVIVVTGIQTGDALTKIRHTFDRFPTDPERWPGFEG